MAKHRSKWSFRTYHRRICEGRGSGTMEQYKPWITIHDLASRGFVSRVYGLKTRRIHHLLSRNETAFFYILDESERVLDIREQFPLLPVDETVQIAQDAGIWHPRDPESRYPYVMTSDFLITTPDGLCVRSVKETKDLARIRVREKLEIERRYWKERGVDWKIVTEEQIDFQKARNIEWMRKARGYPDMMPEDADTESILAFFQELYEGSSLSIAQIARATEEAFLLEKGAGLLTYQYLIMKKRLRVDLSLPMDIVTARTGRGSEVYSWIPTYV